MSAEDGSVFELSFVRDVCFVVFASIYVGIVLKNFCLVVKVYLPIRNLSSDESGLSKKDLGSDKPRNNIQAAISFSD